MSLTPQRILEDGMSFWLAKVLLSAVELGDAFDFTGADFARWCRQVGFRETKVIPLTPNARAAVAYK